jgi:centromeric protein E
MELYSHVCKPAFLDLGTQYPLFFWLFVDGQTGSGKTWTMRGCETDPGMMVLCIRDIFDWVESHVQYQYTLKVAYLEVYNEEINDLLGEGATSKNLRIISEDAARGAVIGGLIEEVCSTPQDFHDLLKRGEASRAYASTAMNSDSSRSHTIYRVTIEVKDLIDEGGAASASQSRVSYLNLVDLAGSERQKSTNATGKVLKEGANINKSLLALGAVINKLGEASKMKGKGAKPVFIPYRDSKLTRILKQSLGGNTMTSVSIIESDTLRPQN